jgi:hypothetical protein
MDDEVKKVVSPTYPLEEILAQTTGDSENIFPEDSAKDWIENPTRFKLREAKYFFKQVEKAYSDYLNNDTDRS